MATAMGATADILIDVGYPAVDNDEILNESARDLAGIYMGPANISETEMRMGAEDFGYYTQLIPGCFFRLGVRNEEAGIIHNVHTPVFNIDERAIETGMGIMAWLGASL
jgi:hippurate hydrolase